MHLNDYIDGMRMQIINTPAIININSDILTLLQGLDVYEAHVLRKNMETLTIKAGEIYKLHRQQIEAKVFWLLKGQLLLESSGISGNLCYTLLKEELHFPNKLAGKQDALLAVYACTDLVLLRFPLSVFKQLQCKRLEFCLKINRSLEANNQLLRDIRDLGSFGRISKRIEEVLVYFARECGQKNGEGDIVLPKVLTYQVIAFFANTSTPTVAKTIKHYRKSGLLRPLQRKLIVSREALGQLDQVN